MINSFAKCLQQPLPRAKRQIVSSNGFPFHIDLDLTVTGHVLVSNVRQTSELIKADVTAILTVDQKPLPSPYHESFVCKHVLLLDLEEEDLLGKLPDSIEFIDTYRTDGKSVFVHCNAGQSRSASIVIGYVMWKLNMEFDDAYLLVRKLKPDIRPNDGFQHQLKLFEQMEYRIERSHKLYKQYQLERISHFISYGKAFSEMQVDLNPGSTQQIGSEMLFKCRKCRRLLFTDVNVLNHPRGAGETAFLRPWQKLGSAGADLQECTESLFVEPTKWMGELGLDELQGKILCPKCSSKLGSWNWSGERCRCGQWVAPSFHMDRKKVDLTATLPSLAGRKQAASSVT